MWSAAYHLEARMAYTGRPPGGQSSEDEPTGTAEIKQQLDEVIKTGHEGLEMTKEIRASVSAIRRRLQADRPLILPRRSDEIPSAPRRQDRS